MKVLDRLLAPVRRWAMRGEQREFLSLVRGQMKRAFNGANDDRTTKNHWGSASSGSINADLIAELSTLRDRIRYERQNNGYLEGIVSSSELDVVGPHGPSLQLITKDEVWSSKAEAIWSSFWECPDLNGQMSGPEMLRQAERQRWECGESVWQIVTDRGAQGFIKTRVLTIQPRRLETPYGAGLTADVTLGVRRTKTGKPISYFIREDTDTEQLQGFGTTFVEIPAAYVIHDYDVDDSGQARGVPDLACALQPIGQMRDCDKDVLQAMRMAAMLGVFFYSENSEAAPMSIGSTTDLEGGTAGVAPPGWKPFQMQPAQPGNQYAAFYDKKLAEMGRPAGVPLMMVKLDSSGHSYSSARFDGQTYDRSVYTRQALISRRKLNRLFHLVRQEAQLAGKLGPTPADLMVAWVWPRRPHVDPNKEASAINQQLADGTIDKGTACAEYGRDADVIAGAIERDKKRGDQATLDRIVAMQTAINDLKAKVPGLDQLSWAHVISSAGATTAPGAYLDAAKDQPTANDEAIADTDSQGKNDA